jgi:hypothetical protein
MNNRALLWLGLVVLAGCGGESPYRDTSELEMPPVVELPETRIAAPSQGIESQKAVQEIVRLDDSDVPSVLKIKKFQDRAWELVIEALNKHNIEIIDKNREAGWIQVKYDASEDSGKLFGNVRFFWFEEEYSTAKYEIKLSWNGTETDVTVRLLEQAESEDDDEELADGSTKLLKRLYKAINDINNPEEKEV